MKGSCVKTKAGSALIIALWTIVLLSLLISSLAFNMHLESRLTSFHRKRLQAKEMARNGIQWGKFVLVKSASAFSDEETYGEEFRIKVENLRKGLSLTGLTPIFPLGETEGTFKLDIIPEQGRRNVNFMERLDWEEMFDRSGVPEEDWDSLIDAFLDWTDKNDLHRLNGAESDDEFYEEAGYEVKNGPVSFLDELALIKGFSERLLYGGPGEEEDDPPYRGIANLLTTFGNGKVNVNTASMAVLMTLPEIDEFAIGDILEGRLGIDGAPGTEDDGFDSVQQVIAYAGLPSGISSRITVKERRYIRMVSIGEYQDVRMGIWSIFLVNGRDVIPVFWREEQMP